MSLISKINVRPAVDVINQGFRFSNTGTMSAVGSRALLAGRALRNIAVYSYVFTSDQATAVRVTLSFQKSGSTTVTVFDGYVAIGAPVSHTFNVGDEHYGDELFDLVLTVTGGNVGYAVHGRIVGVLTPLGYIYNSW